MAASRGSLSGRPGATAAAAADGAPVVNKQFPPDWALFLVTLLLLGGGVVMVFNASYPLAIEVKGDQYYFLKKQALWAAIGLCGMFAAMRIPYWKLAGWAIPALVTCIGLLAAVLVVGHGAQGAQRWIGYGPIRIQPSEFAKLAVVLYLARVMAIRPLLTRNLWGGVVPVLLVGLFVVTLVELQPDLGTAITLLLSILLMFFAGGARTRWIVTLLVLFGIVGLGLALRHGGTEGYRWKRMVTFVRPEADYQGAGYQITHSKIALGTGGWTGVGFGESREKRLGNLPAQRTDFIFAIVGEELGLVGSGTVLALFLLLAARGFHIAMRCTNRFGALLATGITGMVSVQALVNIGVVTASLPATGVPLPFLSYGGSSLVPTLFGIGILLNISQHPFYRERREKTDERRRPSRRQGAPEGAVAAAAAGAPPAPARWSGSDLVPSGRRGGVAQRPRARS